MRKHRHNQALTLVELTVAMAIVTMLLVAAMTVTTAFARSEARERAQVNLTQLSEPLRELLTADVFDADEYFPSQTGCVFKTRSALDPRTMERRHLPTSVEYAVQTIGAQPWLVRIQRPLDGRKAWREVVCSGVRSFTAVPVEEIKPGPIAPRQVPSTRVPNALIVTVEFEPPRAQFQVLVRRD